MTAGWLVLSLGGLARFAPVATPQTARAQSSLYGAITHTTSADFGTCSVLPETANRILTDVMISRAAGGEVRLVPLLEEHFDGATLNLSRWDVGKSFDAPWWSGQMPSVANGILSFEGAWIRSEQTFDQPRIAVEGRIKYGDDKNTGHGDFGFGKFSQVSGPPNMLLITDGAGKIIANSFHPANTAPVRDYFEDLDVTQFHNIRLVVNQWATVDYYINGSYLKTHTYPTPVFTQPAHVWFFSYGIDDDWVYADWVRVAHYPIPSGSYVSCAEDAGQLVNWTLAWTADTPTNSSLFFRTRTSPDGVTWSPWSSPFTSSGTAIPSPTGRYIQYQANLATNDPAVSPELQAVTLKYFGPARVELTPAIVALAPNEPYQFSAQVYDTSNRPLTGWPAHWSVLHGGGLVDQHGRFTATLPAGFYRDTLAVNVADITGTASIGVGLAGFEVALPAMGERNKPFSATIRLRQATDLAVVENFTEVIHLNTGNGGIISPTQVRLESGIWQGQLTLTQAGRQRQLWATYGPFTGTTRIDLGPFETYLPLLHN